MLTLGEVQTGLLRNSTSVESPHSRRLLTLRTDEPATSWDRPIAYARSPEILSGVDCLLATTSGRRVPVIGTVGSRATLVGGSVLQGSAHVRVIQVDSERRQPWAHFLARPATAETPARLDDSEVVQAFFAADPPPQGVDVGAIAGRVMETVQAGEGLDGVPPFRALRTRLRWAAVADDDAEPTVRAKFSVRDRSLRTLQVRLPATLLPAVPELCEDLAVHDWLLTTLLRVIDRSRLGDRTRLDVDTLGRLRPAVDFLMHLWMPGTRLPEQLWSVWDLLERREGFSRQWQASVNRIRDHVALSTIALLDTVDRLPRMPAAAPQQVAAREVSQPRRMPPGRGPRRGLKRRRPAGPAGQHDTARQGTGLPRAQATWQQDGGAAQPLQEETGSDGSGRCVLRGR